MRIQVRVMIASDDGVVGKSFENSDTILRSSYGKYALPNVIRAVLDTISRLVAPFREWGPVDAVVTDVLKYENGRLAAKEKHPDDATIRTTNFSDRRY